MAKLFPSPPEAVASKNDSLPLNNIVDCKLNLVDDVNVINGSTISSNGPAISSVHLLSFTAATGYQSGLTGTTEQKEIVAHDEAMRHE